MLCSFPAQAVYGQLLVGVFASQVPGLAEVGVGGLAEKMCKPVEEVRKALDELVVANLAEVELGKALFFDPRLSKSGFISCNSCHNLTTGGAVNPAQSEVARVAMGGDVGANPYLNAAYNQAAQQVTDNFQKNLVPTMDRNFAATGRLGSNAYAQARNTAEQQTGKALGDLATNIYGGAYQSDMANKNAMLGQYAALGQQGIANQLAGAGLYQQGVGNQTTGVGLTPTLQGLRYDDATRQLQTGTSMQQAPWLPLQYGSSIINPLAAPTSQMQSTNTPIGTQLIGMGTSIAGTAAMFSDRRLKRNIRRVGSRDNGLPIYSYRYIWDAPDVLRVGVMADEALAVAPEAVDTSGAYMAVDYARL